jgi:uncharacterized protein involved in exopolysaccharide biosynthesis
MANIDHAMAQQPIDDDGLDILAWMAPVAAGWKLALAAAIVVGAIGVGASYLVAPKFTAINVFLPPQQQQNSAASALASLGALSGIATAPSTRNSPDQYIALMQSVTVSDHIIAKFDLRRVWEHDYLDATRKQLLRQASFTAGKKDGLIRIEVTDKDPKRAAAMANQYVEELRSLTNGLAVTEAQQRRMFFEHLLEQTRDKLAAAQKALEASGYTAGALNSEPRSAAEGYARVQAERAAAQVRLQVLRSTLAEGAAEVRIQQESVNALSTQLAQLESKNRSDANTGDYVNRYREFKYQETLFDLFAREYETARVDESREGALIQVLDPAMPPEHKSSPSRALFGLVGAFLGLLGASLLLVRKSIGTRRTLGA